MPVQKEKEYEITFKNLRHREIPCLVIAVPQKDNSSLRSDGSGTNNSQEKTRTKILKSLKQRLNRLYSTPNKRSKSLTCLDKKSEVSSKVVKKRVIRRNTLESETLPIKETKIDETLNVNETTPNESAKATGKRQYRKKIQIQVSATITPIAGSPTSTSTESCYGTPVIIPESPKKRVYRKKLRIPAVPHNTPVMGHASGGASMTSASFLSLCNSHSGVITVGRRGQGRPRATLPPKPSSETGEESTMSQGSDKGSTSRKYRRSLFPFDSDGEDEAENQVSEYELLRQKNIEENLKKLREIFSEQGLKFEEKTTETPKKRKSYSRVPLPPPRPRSQRIVVRRTSTPLDFSELDEKLTMSEAGLI